MRDKGCREGRKDEGGRERDGAGRGEKKKVRAAIKREGIQAIRGFTGEPRQLGVCITACSYTTSTRMHLISSER